MPAGLSWHPIPMKVQAVVPICLFSLLIIALFHASPDRAAAQSSETSDPQVQIAMRNVIYHYTGPIAVHVFRLQGELLPTKPGSTVVFDDKNSFKLALTSAQIAISCDALARVLNENVFSASDAPLKNLSLQGNNNQLIIKGKLHQKADVSFEATGTLTAEGDGRIRVHTEYLKAAHLPVKGLMDLLGLDIARMIHTKKIQGVSVDKDDLILNPEQILPAPRYSGKSLSRSHSRQRYRANIRHSAGPELRRKTARQLHRISPRFGKITMHDSDLIMIDIDSRDPLDFYLDHYQDQLVAGYSKSTPEYGLRAYVRDYDKIPHRPLPNHTPQ